SPDSRQYVYNSDREGPSRIYVASVDGGAARAITPDSIAVAAHPRWTHDGQAIVFWDVRTRNAYRVALSGGEPETLASGVSAIDDCVGRLVIVYVSSPGCPMCPRMALREKEGQERDLLRFAATQEILHVRCDREGRSLVYAVTELPFNA